MPKTLYLIRKRLLIAGVLGLVSLLSLSTVHVALAASPNAPGGQEVNPVTIATHLSVTAEHDGEDATTVTVPAFLFVGFDDLSATVHIPAQAMTRNGVVSGGTIIVDVVKIEEDRTTAEMLAQNADKPLGSDVTYAGRALNVAVTTVSDGAVADISDEVSFNPPMEIAFDLSPAEWQIGMGDPGAFVVRYFETELGKWLAMETNVDPFVPRAVGRVTQVGEFGLFIELAPPPPQGGDITPSALVLALIAVAGLALIAGGAYMVRRERHAAAA